MHCYLPFGGGGWDLLANILWKVFLHQFFSVCMDKNTLTFLKTFLFYFILFMFWQLFVKCISKFSVKSISAPIFPVCMDKKTLTFLKISSLVSTICTTLQILNRNCARKWSLDQQETNCHIQYSILQFYWILQQGSITFLFQVTI